MKASLNLPTFMPSFNEVYGYLEMGKGKSYNFRDSNRILESINVINKILHKKYDKLVYIRTEQEISDWNGERDLYLTPFKNHQYGNLTSSMNSPLLQVKWKIVIYLDSSISNNDYSYYHKRIIDLFRLIGVSLERTHDASFIMTASTTPDMSQITSSVCEREPDNIKTVPFYTTCNTDLFFTMYVVMKEPVISSFTVNSSDYSSFDFEVSDKKSNSFYQRVVKWFV